LKNNEPLPILSTIKSEPPIVKSSPDKINFKDAIESKRFSYIGMSLYKGASEDGNIGRIWVKKEIIDPKTGEKQEWLVTYTTDEDDLVYSLASKRMKKIADYGPFGVDELKHTQEGIDKAVQGLDMPELEDTVNPLKVPTTDAEARDSTGHQVQMGNVVENEFNKQGEVVDILGPDKLVVKWMDKPYSEGEMGDTIASSDIVVVGSQKTAFDYRENLMKGYKKPLPELQPGDRVEDTRTKNIGLVKDIQGDLVEVDMGTHSMKVPISAINKLSALNKHSVNIQIIPVTSWQRGKVDPTEYDATTDTIRVRGDYDVNNDPAGWMVHEKVHATLAAAGQQNNSGNYPDNPIEERAYKTQFNYLKSLGHTFDDIFQIPTMEHKAPYRNIFAKWWNASSPQQLPTLRTAGQPKPQDIPIAPGIKSKNITMDESGGGGTAKVTVEFSDVNKGLQFYQEEVGQPQAPPKPPEQPKEEEKPEASAEQGPPPVQGPQLPNLPTARLKFNLQVISKVVHRKDGWHVVSEEGKNLGGPYPEKKKAIKRLKQVEYFKHHGSADVVKMDVPFLIREMEYSKEDAKTDQDLHKATENMIDEGDKVLEMSDYDKIFDKPKKGSLKLSWQEQGPGEDFHQNLVDEAYDLWQKPENNWNKDQFLQNLPSQAHRDAVILGNLNYQVGNGGFEQWFGNDYGDRDAEYLIGTLLPAIGTPSAKRVMYLVEEAYDLREEYDPYEGEPNEDASNDLDNLDSEYYAIDDEFMKDVNQYLYKLKIQGSLIFSSSVKQAASDIHDYLAENVRDTEDLDERDVQRITERILSQPWCNSSKEKVLKQVRDWIGLEKESSADEIHTWIRVKRVLDEMGVDETTAAKFVEDVKKYWQEYIELPDEQIYDAYKAWKDEEGPRKMTDEDWDQRFENDAFNREQFGSKKASLKFSQTEEDYDFYNDNYRFNSGEEHECEDCGAPGAKLYNTFGQKLQIGGFSSDLELCDNCHKERFPEHWRYKKKASYIYKPGEQIGYHGREGRIVREDNGGYIVYFTDTNEEQWLDKEELLEQEGLKEPENEFDKVLKLRDRARERRDTDMSKETNFTLWFNKNKNETSYWEGYSNFIKTAAQHKQFKDWMKEKFADVVIEDEPETKDGAAYELPDGSGFMTGTVGSKQASGVALNILPDLFEDKFAMSKIPPELRLLRSNAKQALSKVVEHMQVLGRESTPADFPMEWFYKDQGYVVPDSIGEVRAQLQEIIDYANRATGNNFYGNMKSSFKVISKSGLQGVEIIRELIDGKINKYGYINEKNQFVVLPNYRELRINSQLNRPDTGETVKVIKYVDVSLGSTANMVETLMKKKAGDEADDLAEKEWSDKGEEDWSRKPSEGFIPTNRGMQTPDDIVSDLTFLNYAYNRDRSPEITPERWAKVYGPNTETMEMRYQREKASGKTFTKKDINKAFIKYAIDVSDEIPPMGWDASTPGKPAGAGAPKEPMQGLQDKDKEQEEKKNVIYDSSSDTGPQFQTTINPATKEVTVKFMDSPQKEALDDAMKTQMQSPQLPTLNTTPQNNQGTPGTPGGPGANEEPNQFKNQQVPVSF
jgi:hypothetical protein